MSIDHPAMTHARTTRALDVSPVPVVPRLLCTVPWCAATARHQIGVDRSARACSLHAGLLLDEAYLTSDGWLPLSVKPIGGEQ